MAAIEFTVRGDEEMRARLRRLASAAPGRMSQALRVEAEEIMTRSKQEYVPVDLGTVRSSGHVKPVETRGKEISVTLVYGNAAAPYALSIHEHPSRHSPPAWRGKRPEQILSVRQRRPWVLSPGGGRGPKYLNRPMKRAIPGMGDRIARQMERL